MDYEEALLQITDVLKAHNRYHMNTPDHEQAVKLIRDIVTPEGKWVFAQYDANPNIGNWHCSLCRHIIFQKFKSTANYCPNCGADMRGEEK